MMNAVNQREQVLGTMRGFRNGVVHGLLGLGSFAFGYIACNANPQLIGWRPARRPHDMADFPVLATIARSEEHTSELQSLMRTSYAVFCLTHKTTYTDPPYNIPTQIST